MMPRHNPNAIASLPQDFYLMLFFYDSVCNCVHINYVCLLNAMSRKYACEVCCVPCENCGLLDVLAHFIFFALGARSCEHQASVVRHGSSKCGHRCLGIICMIFFCLIRNQRFEINFLPASHTQTAVESCHPTLRIRRQQRRNLFKICVQNT